MGATFPIPVLAVAADAVRDLEGRDALSGLWTLFTKCKESLQDGRRLENISWRLWYREIMLTNLERERDLDNEKFPCLTLEKANDQQELSDSIAEKALYPIQPLSDPSTLPPPYTPSDVGNTPLPQTTTHQPDVLFGSSPGISSSPAHPASLSPTPSPRLSPSIPSHNRRPSTSRSRRSSFLNGTNGTPLSVGKIIFDMLPTSSSTTNSGESNKAPTSVTALFIARPALSHKSTSSTIVSGEDLDNKPEVPNHLVLTQSASSMLLDPMIKMIPIDTSLSPTPPPLAPASQNVGNDGVRSSKLSLQDLSTVSIIARNGNGVSSLPTPEPEELGPNVVVVGNSPSVAADHDIAGFSSSMTIPSLSIPSPPNVSAVSVSLANDPDDKESKRDLGPSSDSNSLQLAASIRQSALYTGPPSPSLSDSYACAHPGEVGVKEVGLLPSLSISHDVNMDEERRTAAEPLNENQTPPSSSTIATVQIQDSLQRHQPPTLVVVNPTPNPTPHPTPPATPLIHGSIGPGGVTKSQWLALPEGATGSREHQLLQAAQVHYLGAHTNDVRLPAAFISNSSSKDVTMTSVTALLTMTGPVSRDLDRSRSDRTAVCSESHSQVSPENAEQEHYSNSQSDPRASSLSSQHKRSSSFEQEQDQDQDAVGTGSSEEIHGQQQLQLLKDSPKRLSISSTTSASDRSSLSGRAESTSTTNTSASEYDCAENNNTPSKRKATEKQAAAAAMLEIHPGGIGMALHGPKRLGSLSTIQSMSTLTDRKKDLGYGLRNSDSDIDARVSVGAGANLGSDEEAILERDEEEDAGPLSSMLPLSGDRSNNMSPRNDKRRKRNSAPTLPTSSQLLFASPTGSGSMQQGQQYHRVSSPKSTTSTTSGIHTHHNNYITKRKQITAGGRSSSRSRSAGGSSLGKSRSRSREAGLGLGVGGFGMTQAQAAPTPLLPPPPPPSVAPTRKAPMVASGRGRAKVVLSRTSAKAKGAIRRNSAGTVAHNDSGKAELELLERERLEKERVEKEKEEKERMEKEKEREENERAEREREENERAEREYQERMKIERAGKARERNLPEVDAETAALEERRRALEERRKVVEAELALAAKQEREAEEAEAELARRRAALQQQSTGVGLAHGSNGSGQSKSASSGSGLSPARSKVKGKGKGKQRDDGQRGDSLQQQRKAHHPHQPAVEHPTTEEPRHFLQETSKQLSKPQLRQLQKMEQLLVHQTKNQTQQQPHLQLHQQQEREGVKPGGGERPSASSRKGKEREVAMEPVVSERKPSKSNGTKTNNVLLDPNLEQHLAAPLLPQNRRKIVLATSESDFETDSDDGSWSSEEMTGDEEDRLAQEEQLRQEQLHQQRLHQQHQQQLLQQQQLQQKLLQQQQIQQQRQRQQQQQQQQLQQHHHQPTRPPGVQRTQSNHYPAPNNTRAGKQSSRAAQQRHQNQVNAQAILDAAAEAQRQREMFVKLPTSSFQNLANARTKSVGLLTQLMNPNPEIFPPNHPYRRGFSSTEIKPGHSSGFAPLRPLTALTPAANKDGQGHPPIAEERVEKRDDKKSATTTGAPAAAQPQQQRMHFSPPTRPGGLTRTKSAAAIPVSSKLAIGSMMSKVLPIVDHNSAMPVPSAVIVTSSAGKIRLGPPPADAEMEDDDDESDDDSDSGFSKSVAHERLKALVRMGALARPLPPPPPPPLQTQVQPPPQPQAQPAPPPVAGPSTQPAQLQPQPAQAQPQPQPAQANGDDNAVPNWVVSQPQAPQQQQHQQPQQPQHQQPPPQQHQRQQQRPQPQQQYPQPQQPQHTRTRSNPQQRSTVQFADIGESSFSRNPAPAPAPAPIPVGYPYNLPISAVPSTPRTTRRQMLSTELPESLRRNLLWERQVSNGNLPAMRRSASGGGSRHNVLGGLRRLTTAPPMVQLRPKGTAPPQEGSSNPRQRRSDVGPSNTNNPGSSNTNNVSRPRPPNPDAQNHQGLTRNQSWNNDFHLRGW